MQGEYLEEWRAIDPLIAGNYETYYQPRIVSWAKWFRHDNGHLWCESDGYVGPLPPHALVCARVCVYVCVFVCVCVAIDVFGLFPLSPPLHSFVVRVVLERFQGDVPVGREHATGQTIACAVIS
jgi:hypothetical protein